MRQRQDPVTKHVNFRDHLDAYATTGQRKFSKQPEALTIDSKFLSSDEESADERVPVKRIKLHRTNIFANVKTPTRHEGKDQREHNESKFSIQV